MADYFRQLASGFSPSNEVDPSIIDFYGYTRLWIFYWVKVMKGLDRFSGSARDHSLGLIEPWFLIGINIVHMRLENQWTKMLIFRSR